MDASATPAPLPFGSPRAPAARAASPHTPQAHAPAGSIGARAAVVQDTVDLANAPVAGRARAVREKVAPLLAARVQPGVSFGGGPRAPEAPLALYTRPADANAAALRHAANARVHAGSNLDVTA
ncbi:MAG: hypothetical protein SFY69_07010 [Planctomycetota bacterium]|nr:hypothetical protein [Planctomycetota bacterium]